MKRLARRSNDFAEIAPWRNSCAKHRASPETALRTATFAKLANGSTSTISTFCATGAIVAKFTFCEATVFSATCNEHSTEYSVDAANSPANTPAAPAEVTSWRENTGRRFGA